MDVLYLKDSVPTMLKKTFQGSIRNTIEIAAALTLLLVFRSWTSGSEISTLRALTVCFKPVTRER